MILERVSKRHSLPARNTVLNRVQRTFKRLSVIVPNRSLFALDPVSYPAHNYQGQPQPADDYRGVEPARGHAVRVFSRGRNDCRGFVRRPESSDQCRDYQERSTEAGGATCNSSNHGCSLCPRARARLDLWRDL